MWFADSQLQNHRAERGGLGTAWQKVNNPNRVVERQKSICCFRVSADSWGLNRSIICWDWEHIKITHTHMVSPELTAVPRGGRHVPILQMRKPTSRGKVDWRRQAGGRGSGLETGVFQLQTHCFSFRRKKNQTYLFWVKNSRQKWFGSFYIEKNWRFFSISVRRMQDIWNGDS